jgi:hypothetical protein
MSSVTVGASVETMDTFDDLLRQWSDAEAVGDVAALDVLLDADFRGDGPLGSVLSKEQWLRRYLSGDLTTEVFEWKTTEVRVTNDIAVGFGIQSQIARYRGEDWSGEFVCALVAVRSHGRWTIVNVQTRPPG